MSGGWTSGLTLRDIEAALPAERPPLTDIASMPFPASMVAMRRFYCKDWHKPEPDGETPGKWSVEINYSYRTEEVWGCEVEAATEKEAIEKAEDEFDKSSTKRCAYAEIDEITAEFVGGDQ